MSIDATLNRAFTISGMNFNISTTVSSDLGPQFSVDLAVAKSGTLSTRTDDNTGTLTLESGHGVQTGDRLDIYWEDDDGNMERRYGVTVGTVSGTSVPFDLGAGDNLPAAATEVTAMVPDEEVFVVTGDNAVSVAAACANGGTVVFATAANATVLAVELTPTNASYVWTTGAGTNPLAGGSVTKVFVSQPSALAEGEIYGIVQAD
jgi:hypothetical protein